jgi:hypothetical protein
MARRRGGTRRYSRARTRRSGVPVSEIRPTITVTVPVPVNVRARTVSYTYPQQIQRSRRVVRRQLSPLQTRYVMRRVRVVLPRHLPVVRGSYVSIDRNGRLNNHSRRQLEALLAVENNRRRYRERKWRGRKARNGQLESAGSTHAGLVAEAVRRGLSAETIQDAAMVARALERSGR